MPKYEVTCAIPVFLTITVEAEDDEAAEEEASPYMSLTSYAGNGGSHRLVGTYSSHVSISPGDEILEGVKVREVTE